MNAMRVNHGECANGPIRWAKLAVRNQLLKMVSDTLVN